MGDIVPLIGQFSTDKVKKMVAVKTPFKILDQVEKNNLPKAEVSRRPVKKLNRLIKYCDIHNVEKIKKFEKAIRKCNVGTRIYKRLASEYIKLNCVEDAISCYEKIIEIDPKDADAYLDLVDYCYQEYWKKTNENENCDVSKYLQIAEGVLSKAIKEFPDNPEMYMELSTFYSYDEKEYIRCLNIGRNLAYKMIPKEKELGNNEQVCGLEETLTIIEHDLLSAYEGIGDFKSVKEIGVALENREDKSDSTYVCLGKAYKELGEMVEAKRVFEKSLNICEKNLEASTELISLYIEDKEFEKARDCLKTVIEVYKEFGDDYQEFAIKLNKIEDILNKKRLNLIVNKGYLKLK
jgi:tetratricopeptide (TPR) repeat protein